MQSSSYITAAVCQVLPSSTSSASTVIEITLQAGGLGVYTLGYLNRSERAGLYFYGKLQIQQEVQYKRQIGQDRQLKHPHMGVLEQRPKGIFPPINVVRACYLEGYILYYHSRSPWRFFVSILRQQSVWTLIGTASDIKQESIIIYNTKYIKGFLKKHSI